MKRLCQKVADFDTAFLLLTQTPPGALGCSETTTTKITLTLMNKRRRKKLTVANWLFAQTTHVDAAICGLACRVVFGR